MSKKLILISGVAGSGKTHIGKEIAKRLKNSIYIDKDTISRFFSESVLVLLGEKEHDRESKIYLEIVRKLEYKTMMKHALENLELGKNVICSAPFLMEISDKEWIKEISIAANIREASLIKVWIQADESTTKERLIKRRADRDNYKLSNWDDYITKTKHTPPEINDIHIINNLSNVETPLSVQILKFIEEIDE
jgi:predicted kinase